MSKGVLRNLRIKRVAVVDMGANFDKKTGDGAHITLWKSVHKDSPSLGDVHVPATGGKKKKPSDKETPVKKSWKDMFKSAVGLMTEADPAVRTTKAADLLKDAEAMPDDGDGDEGTPVHKANDAMCKCADCTTKRADEPMNKRFTELEKKFQDSEARAIAAETLAKGLVEKAERDEVTSILKSFRATPINLDTDLQKFYDLKKASPEVFKRTIEIMRGTDEQLAQSALYKSFGSNSNGGGDAWAQLEAKATELVSKSASKLTKEQAIEQICLDPTNAALVKQYRDQQQ